MTAANCPNPGHCPIPDPDPETLKLIEFVRHSHDTKWFNVYPTAHSRSLFNPTTHGNGRFSPLIDHNGTVIPTTYLAKKRSVALLETCFHEVQPQGQRVVSIGRDLHRRGLRKVTTPKKLKLVDFTDPALNRLGLGRDQIVSSTPEHYPCTREWGAALRQHHKSTLVDHVLVMVDRDRGVGCLCGSIPIVMLIWNLPFG